MMDLVQLITVAPSVDARRGTPTPSPGDHGKCGVEKLCSSVFSLDWGPNLRGLLSSKLYTHALHYVLISPRRWEIPNISFSVYSLNWDRAVRLQPGFLLLSGVHGSNFKAFDVSLFVSLAPSWLSSRLSRFRIVYSWDVAMTPFLEPFVCCRLIKQCIMKQSEFYLSGQSQYRNSTNVEVLCLFNILIKQNIIPDSSILTSKLLFRLSRWNRI